MKLDSLKSRLQTSKNPISVPRLAARVFQEEGVKGFFRGLWIPLFTISFVRTSAYSSTSKNRALTEDISVFLGAASFTIYNRTKEQLHNNNHFGRNNLLDVAASGGLSGAMAGALISFGSARKSVLFSVHISHSRRSPKYRSI